MSSELQDKLGPASERTGYIANSDLIRSIDEEGDAAEEARWREHKAILRRAAEELAHRRAKAKSAALVGAGDSFQRLADSLEYASPEACCTAVRSLYELDPDRAASFFNIALRDSSPQRRRKIGAALTGSGLVNAAIEYLAAAGHQNSYSAFTLLFLVAKAGEVQPLLRVIESHPNIELRLAVIRLLASSGEPDIIPALQSLDITHLPSTVRSALTEVITQLTQSDTAASAR
ncbi:MAG TPA: hypothetical protein VJ180_16135 [Pyrinomonadaceae bacterium]|nr:hypothetical protein [Pyrinomonadaceae bacterium]